MTSTFERLTSHISKTSMAIVVAAACVLGGLGYAILTQDKDLVTFLAGAGIGYLLKDAQTKPT